MYSKELDLDEGMEYETQT